MNSSLVSPFNLGNRTFKNRMIAAPPPSHTCDFNGYVTADTIDYYLRLAETGVSAVIVEGGAISHAAKTWARQLDVSGSDVLAGLSQLAEKIRRGGAFPVLQLYHGGFNAMTSAGKKRYGAGQPLTNKGATDVYPLTLEMIEQITRDYAAAATMAWNAGFSGIEVAGADGSLIQQFLSPLTNPRDDEYGIKNAGGALFARQIIRGIKEAAPDLTLFMRISLKDMLPGGASMSLVVSVARLFKQEGVDIFHLTEGLLLSNPLILHPAIGKSAPEAPFAEDAQIFKNEIKHPVVLSGKLAQPAIANAKITRDVCDFVSLGRTLNRAPNWPTYAKAPENFSGRLCLRCKVCISAAWGCPDDKIPFARLL